MKKLVLKNKSDPSKKIATHYKFDEPNMILIFFENLTLKLMSLYQNLNQVTDEVVRVWFALICKKSIFSDSALNFVGHERQIVQFYQDLSSPFLQ